MCTPDPQDARESYLRLISEAEGFLSRASVSGGARISWRRRAMAWLKEHAGTSGLYEDFRTSPPDNIELGLKILQRASKTTPMLHNARIFIVHGHDHVLRNSVAKYLKHLGVRPVVLDEQPSEGKTIIEKFVKHSDVHFAVVLLTADDLGGTKNTPYDEQQPRARQHVILELGFFLAKLGRENVVALYTDGVEKPSDYSGVLYISAAKEGDWKKELLKELIAAGIIWDSGAY